MFEDWKEKGLGLSLLLGGFETDEQIDVKI
jgi:hypothetical protein